MRKIVVFIVAVALFASAHTVAHAAANIHTSAPRIHLKNGESTNWSGYAALTNILSPQSGAVQAVTGKWIVPTLLCGSLTTYSSAWVGIDGYSDNTVEQTGTEHDCSSGKAIYSMWYEMYPKYPKTIPIVIKPGDVISASVTYIGSSRFTLQITNETTSKTYTTTQRANAKRQSAEWIAEAPSSLGGVLPLANFGTMQFSSSQATINGMTGGINNSSWQNDQIIMASSSYTKAQPSSLSSDGESFLVTWMHE